jgi:hypothetical protein
MKIEVTPEQLGTIRLALMGWAVRCKREAEGMDEWAAEKQAEGDHVMAAKCRANAKASREFKADAETVLQVLK